MPRTTTPASVSDKAEVQARATSAAHAAAASRASTKDQAKQTEDGKTTSKTAKVSASSAKSSPAAKEGAKPAPHKAAPEKRSSTTPEGKSAGRTPAKSPSAPAARKAPAKASEKPGAAHKPASSEKPSAHKPAAHKPAAPTAEAAKSRAAKVPAAKAPAARVTVPGRLGQPVAPRAVQTATYAGDTSFLAQQREALAKERTTYLEQARQLRAEAESLVEEMEPGDVQFDEESGEGGTTTVDRERDLALSAQALAAVEEIDAALEKIETGRYGVCEGCGQLILKARLEALPYARLCIACKSGGLSRR